MAAAIYSWNLPLPLLFFFFPERILGEIADRQVNKEDGGSKKIRVILGNRKDQSNVTSNYYKILKPFFCQ